MPPTILVHTRSGREAARGVGCNQVEELRHGYTPAYTSGRVDQPYSVALTVSGATAPVSFSVLSGALPAGLSMNAAGVITGTPTTPQTATFTVGVVDSRPDTASQQFELTVNPKPIGGGSSSGSSGGCSQGGASLPGMLAALALLALGVTRRRLRVATQSS